jgi:hypothetical protein
MSSEIIWLKDLQKVELKALSLMEEKENEKEVRRKER